MQELPSAEVVTLGGAADIENGSERQVDIAPRSKSQGWRDRINVHPAADLFPMMPDEELEVLGNDLKEHGLRHPLVFYCDRSRRRRNDQPRADELILVDGRNRLAAMVMAGIELFDADSGHLSPNVLCEADPVEVIWRSAGTDFDPFAYVISANLHRRHLSRDKKRETVASLLKARPDRSDRETAKIAKVSHPTVAVIRAELEATGDVENLSTRVDTAGRQQPAHRPPPSAVVHRSSLPPAPSNEEQIRRLREQQAQRRPEPARPMSSDETIVACFDPLMQRLVEHREGLLHVPLDQLARAVLKVMARLGVTIELLEEAAGQ